uniref:Large envelope protein n=1 Tax=Hepatitis B virus TaxID=10407 RepID=A0A1Y0DIG3_HBV|nr:large surface protein [Hepatitis B virus]
MGQNLSTSNPLGFFPDHQLDPAFRANTANPDWDFNPNKDTWPDANKVGAGAFGLGFTPPHGGLLGWSPQAQGILQTLPANPPPASTNRQSGRQPTPLTPPLRNTHPQAMQWNSTTLHNLPPNSARSQSERPCWWLQFRNSKPCSDYCLSLIVNLLEDWGPCAEHGEHHIRIPRTPSRVTGGVFLVDKNPHNTAESRLVVDFSQFSRGNYRVSWPKFAVPNLQSLTNLLSSNLSCLSLDVFIIFLFILLLCLIFLLVLLDYQGMLPVCPLIPGSSTTSTGPCRTCMTTAQGTSMYPSCCCTKPSDGNCTCIPIPSSWAFGKFLWEWASARFSWLSLLVPFVQWFVGLSPTVWLSVIWMMWYWGPSLYSILSPFLPLLPIFFCLWVYI